MDFDWYRLVEVVDITWNLWHNLSSIGLYKNFDTLRETCITLELLLLLAVALTFPDMRDYSISQRTLWSHVCALYILCYKLHVLLKQAKRSISNVCPDTVAKNHLKNWPKSILQSYRNIRLGSYAQWNVTFWVIFKLRASLLFNK